ncbi:MAG: hypothetical protein SFW35_02745 [Chitinophagales bacterium]|nr:hypothetical protein [Chitinophagales bacterium]
MLYRRKKKKSNFLVELREWILVIATVLTLIFGSISQGEGSQTTLKDILKITTILNIVAIVTGLVLIKPLALNIQEEELDSFKKLLPNCQNKDIGNQNERVNLLITQFVKHFHLFLFFLLAFYIVQFIETFSLNDFNIQDLKKKYNIYDLFNDAQKKHAVFIVFVMIENSLDIISAAFLYTTFKILYKRTISTDGKMKSTLDNNLMFGIVGIFILVQFLAFVGVFNTSNTSDDNISYYSITVGSRLVTGVFNGLTMALLFSRFNSMEYFFKKLKWETNFLDIFYYIGIIYILPIYVLTQAFYGLFDAGDIFFDDGNGSSDGVVIFKSIVFSLCFFGKSVLILLLHRIITYKWMHVYIHLSLASYDLPYKLLKNLSDARKFGEHDDDE